MWRFHHNVFPRPLNPHRTYYSSSYSLSLLAPSSFLSSNSSPFTRSPSYLLQNQSPSRPFSNFSPRGRSSSSSSTSSFPPRRLSPPPSSSPPPSPSSSSKSKYKSRWNDFDESSNIRTIEDGEADDDDNDNDDNNGGGRGKNRRFENNGRSSSQYEYNQKSRNNRYEKKNQNKNNDKFSDKKDKYSPSSSSSSSDRSFTRRSSEDNTNTSQSRSSRSFLPHSTPNESSALISSSSPSTSSSRRPPSSLSPRPPRSANPIPYLSHHDILKSDRQEELQEILDIHIPTALNSLVSLAESVEMSTQKLSLSSSSFDHSDNTLISINDVYGKDSLRRLLNRRRFTVKESFTLLFDHSFIQYEFLRKNYLLSSSSSSPSSSLSSSHVEMVWESMIRYGRPSAHNISKIITYYGREGKSKKIREIYENVMDIVEGNGIEDGENIWKKRREKLKKQEIKLKQIQNHNNGGGGINDPMSLFPPSLPPHPLTFLEIDTIAYNSLLSSLFSTGQYAIAKKFFMEAREGTLWEGGSRIKRFELDKYSYAIMMKGMSKMVNDGEYAKTLSSSSSSSSSPSPPSLMLDLFHSMKQHGLHPNHYIYSQLLTFFGLNLPTPLYSLVDIIWKYVEDKENPLNFKINTPMMNVMVSILARQGRMEEISALIKRLKYKYSIKKIPVQRGKQLQFNTKTSAYKIETNDRTVYSILTSLCKSQLYDEAIKFHKALGNGILGSHVKESRGSYMALLTLMVNRRREDAVVVEGNGNNQNTNNTKNIANAKSNVISMKPSSLPISKILSFYQQGLNSGPLLSWSQESDLLRGRKKHIIDLRRYDLSMIPLVLRHELNGIFEEYVKEREKGNEGKKKGGGGGGEERAANVIPRRGIIILLGKSTRDKIQQWDFMQAVKAAETTGEKIENILEMQKNVKMIRGEGEMRGGGKIGRGKEDHGDRAVREKVGDLEEKYNENEEEIDEDEFDDGEQYDANEEENPWTNEVQDDFDESLFDQKGNRIASSKSLLSSSSKDKKEIKVSFSDDPNNPDIVIPHPSQASFRARFVLFWLQQRTPRLKAKMITQFYSLQGREKMGKGGKDGEDGEEEDVDEQLIKQLDEDGRYESDGEEGGIEDEVGNDGDDENVIDAEYENIEQINGNKSLEKIKHNGKKRRGKTQTQTTALSTDSSSSSSLSNLPSSTLSLDSSMLLLPHPSLLFYLECQYSVLYGHDRPPRLRANQLKWWTKSIHRIREEKEREERDDYFMIEELDMFREFLRGKKEWRKGDEETLYAGAPGVGIGTQKKKSTPTPSPSLPTSSSSTSSITATLEIQHLKNRLESILYESPTVHPTRIQRDQTDREKEMLREEELKEGEREEERRKKKEREKEEEMENRKRMEGEERRRERKKGANRVIVSSSPSSSAASPFSNFPKKPSSSFFNSTFLSRDTQQDIAEVIQKNSHNNNNLQDSSSISPTRQRR